jgi:Zn-dependent protease with chaperone function
MTALNRAYTLFIFSLIHFAANSQLRQPVYNFQKDDSLLKKNYYEQALQNKNKLISSLGAQYKKDYQEIYEARFKEVAGLLQSSRSVTEPVAHKYLQSLLKKIIDANPELKGQEIRLVFSRDWWPNAYTMGEGTLAINAGLMIFLDNESELVFVLCHELAHNYLDHSNKSIKKNIETVNSAEFQTEIKRLSKQEYGGGKQAEEMIKKFAFGSHQHKRDNEAEADRQAFLFMKNTGYDCSGINTCLQLLDKIDDSLFRKPIDLEQTFSFSNYPFKKKWIQKESVIFGAMTDDGSPLTQKEKDSLKTHPDCAVRISLLKDSIQQAMPGNLFLVNEALFRQLKKDFYVEFAEQQFNNNNISRNLYYSLQMLQNNENFPYAVYAIARALNLIYENQKNHKAGVFISKEARGYPADYNLLLRMLDRLRLEEIATLNYHFCMQYKSQMSSYAGFDEELNKAIKQKGQY